MWVLKVMCFFLVGLVLMITGQLILMFCLMFCVSRLSERVGNEIYKHMFIQDTIERNSRDIATLREKLEKDER